MGFRQVLTAEVVCCLIAWSVTATWIGRNNCLKWIGKTLAIKILIVDDEKAILSLLYRILTKFDFAVDVAESGEEGIHKIHKTTYDLILTDIKMPGMSGGDLLNYVKVKVDQSLPVIAMSGTPWLFENSNFDAVIAKPFSKQELLEVMSRFVQITEP